VVEVRSQLGGEHDLVEREELFARSNTELYPRRIDIRLGYCVSPNAAPAVLPHTVAGDGWIEIVATINPVHCAAASAEEWLGWRWRDKRVVRVDRLV
jgi:hypothetical protein